MKKILLLLAICTLAACNNVNKEELKKEIRELSAVLQKKC